jgi:hypothetical protein
VGWSICSRGRVEAVAADSDCWAGCGGLYELGCHSSLALVNEEGKASRACADRACADEACRDGACIDGACTGGACTDGACIDGACADGAYVGGACEDGAVIDGAYIDGACVDGAYADGACNIIYSKSPISLGNGGFIYIKGPIKILLSL